MTPAWTSLAIVLTIVYFIAEAVLKKKPDKFESGKALSEERYNELVPERRVPPEQEPYLDMCAYNRSRGIVKKFKNTEEFLDWVKENNPHDYEHNFWLKCIRHDWPKFNPDTKHRQYTNKLAWHNQ